MFLIQVDEEKYIGWKQYCLGGINSLAGCSITFNNDSTCEIKQVFIRFEFIYTDNYTASYKQEGDFIIISKFNETFDPIKLVQNKDSAYRMNAEFAIPLLKKRSDDTMRFRMINGVLEEKASNSREFWKLKRSIQTTPYL